MKKINIIKVIFVLTAFVLSYVNVNAQCDKRDDFVTLPEITTVGFGGFAGTFTTNDGWVCTNVNPVTNEKNSTGGASTVNYKALTLGEKAVCLDGLASHQGSVVSPLLTGGCKSITFDYAVRGTSTTRIVHIYITQGETQSWETTVGLPAEKGGTRYTYNYEDINIAGSFQLHIDNTMTYTGSASWSDDVIIWNICIADYASFDLIAPEFTISGDKKTEDSYWIATVGIDIDSDTEEASLYYTLDGTDPTAESTPYTGPFVLTETARVKAIGIQGDLQSLVADTLISVAGPQSAALPHAETFAGSLGDWYSYSAAGDSQVWYAGEEDEQTFAKMSGADANENFYENEDWLISPSFTAREGHSLAFSFKSARQYDGNSLALKYSTDYAGVGDPATATWTDISDLALWPAEDSDDEWVESGEAVTGTVLPVRFAFVYTSTVADAADWKVGNIHVASVDAPPTGFIPKPYERTLVGVTSNQTENIPLTDLFEYPEDVLPSANLDELGVVAEITSSAPDIIGLYKYEYYAYGNAQTLYLQKYANKKGDVDITVNLAYQGGVTSNVLKFHLRGYIAKDDSFDLPLGTEPFTANVLSNDQFQVAAQRNTTTLEIIGQPALGTATVVSGSPDSIQYVQNQDLPNYSFDTLTYKATTAEGEVSIAKASFKIHRNSYASKVIEFMPAPGQFTNETIAQSNSAKNVLGSAGTIISLGGFGGYVILGFDQPVTNDPQNPYGVDFSVKGNSFTANLYGVWTEPAAVRVMKDTNQNGIPDDGEWYELAGSDYHMSATKKNVEMTYYNPHYDVRYTIPWRTNYGETGALLSNQFHSHPYYPDPFDFGCNKDSMTYTGNVILSSLNMSTPGYVTFYRAPVFGYCDSRGNSADLTNPQNPYFKDEKGAAADGFDLSWAVDSQGNHVELDQIDFVKIYTAGNANAGWLGEWSSEVVGVGITTPDPNYVPEDYYLNYIGITQLKVLKGKTCQYEGFLFKNGRPQNEGTPLWWTSNPSVATVDNTGLLTALDNGETWLYFRQKEDIPTDSIQVRVVELQSVVLEMEGNSALSSDSTSLILGETVSITVQGVDNIASAANRFTYDTYTWTTSKPEIGTIDGGLFTGRQVGQTMVYATSVSVPALVDSILVTVNEVPGIKLVNNPVRIPYYAETGVKKSSELFTTGTNSTTYLHSVVSKNGRITPFIDKNVLNYSITKGNYGRDTLTFNITSYGVEHDIDAIFVYEPDAFPAPKQLLFVDESEGDDVKQSLKAYIPSSNETKTLLEQASGSIRDLAIDGAFAFIASGDYVGRYNISNYEFTHKSEQAGAGNSKLAVYNNLLVVAGHNASGANVTVYNKTDLSVIKQIALSGEAKDVVVVNGKAYALIDKGQTSGMAIISLSGFTVEREIPMNTQGLNVATLLVRGTNIYGVRGYTETTESAVLVFNTTNNSYSTVITGGLETLPGYPSAIEPATGDSILLVNGGGFTAYDAVAKELKDGIVMSKSGLYPTGSVYDAEDGKYYVTYSDAGGKNSAGSVYDAQFAETGSISGLAVSPNTLKISAQLKDNEAPKATTTSLTSSTIYEKATSVTNITINKTAFTDKEDNFTIYVRDILPYASWLSIDPSYTTNGGIRLQAKYTEAIDRDSIVTVTVEAIDNYGLSTLRTFTITIKPRVYKPVVAQAVEDREVFVNSEDIEIPLDGVFTHTASSGVTFAQSVAGNTHPELVNTELADGKLTLSFTPGQIGEATITLRETAKHNTYGEKYAETSFKVTVTYRTGFTEITGDKWSVYPNPFTDYIVIEAAAAGVAVVYDLSGRPVLTARVQAGSNRIETSALAKGVYVLYIGGNAIKIVK